MRVVPFLAATLGLCGFAPILSAEPEWNVAAQGSTMRAGRGRQSLAKTAFCGALRGDLLLGRDRNADFAWGPYATLGTARILRRPVRRWAEPASSNPFG